MAGAPPEPRRPSDGAGAPPRPNVLLISADPVGEKMAGLGIRCWELGRALRDRASVTVAHGGTERGVREGVEIVPFRPHAPAVLHDLIAGADTVITHPQWPLVDRCRSRTRYRS